MTGVKYIIPLYFEAVRLVIEIRPRWFAFENVPGIRNRGIDRVLDRLERADYACWPLVVGASDLRAPHIRKRSWVVGTDAKTVHRLALPWDQPDRDTECAAAEPAREQVGTAGQSRQAVSADAERVCGGAGLREGGTLGHGDVPRNGFALERAITDRLGTIAEDWNGGIAGRLGMDDGLPKGMARPMLAAYGDAILPQIAEIIGRAIMTTAPVTSPARRTVERSGDVGTHTHDQ